MYADMDEHYEEPLNYKLEEAQDKLDNMKYWFKYLLTQIYTDEKLDLDEFERTLQELGADIDVKLPEDNMAIERRQFINPNQVIDITLDLHDWKNWNKQHHKNLA